MKKNTKCLYILGLQLISLSIYAQVSIDKKVNMTGATSDDRRITGVGDVTLAADAVSAQILQKGALIYVGVVGGTPNAITAATSPSFMPQAGSVISFKVSANNTAAVTLNVNGSGSSNVYKNNNAPLIANELKAGQVITVVYDGTDWEMVGADNLGNHQATQNITTSGNDAHDIGSSTNPFKNIYLGSNVKIDGATFVSNGGSTNTLLGETQNTLNTATDNTFVGYQAGKANTTGASNLFSGYGAGMSNISGSFNVFLGYNSGQFNVMGTDNTFLGFQAGYNASTSYNTFIGSYAGYSTTIGWNNTMVGYNSGGNNTSGNYNIFIGSYAGYNVNSDYNTCIGSEAAYNATSGQGNISIGYRSGYNNISGGYNTLLGCESGYNVTSNYNVCVGYGAAYSFTSGQANTIVGLQSGYNGTTGGNNTFLGFQSGFSNAAGEENCYIGMQAGFANTGSYNVAVGGYANYTGSSTSGVFVGYNAGASVSGLTNVIAIGRGVQVATSNTVEIGNNMITSFRIPVAVTIVSDSTRKEKFRLINGEDVLKKVSQLKITSWNYKGHDPKNFRHYGPMAQDFYNAFGYDGVGKIGSDTTINTGDLAGISLVAIQALEKRTSELKELVDKKDKELEEKVKEIASLKSRLEANEKKMDILAEELDELKAFISRSRGADKQASK